MRPVVRSSPRMLGRTRLAAWLKAGVIASSIAGAWVAAQSNSVGVPADGPIAVDAVPVPLNPQNPADVAIGDFVYAGGVHLTSLQTDRLHGLSDLLFTGTDRFTALGDDGILFDARLLFDGENRLVGVADGRLTALTGENGQPLSGKPETDAEGIARLASGDRLVSFEQRHRIWLYPVAGGPPRPAPAPTVSFPANGGMEALAADPDAGGDAYIVGAEESGQTWNCRLSAPACSEGPAVDKPSDFGLVAMTRLPGMRTAYLLRAYDRERGNRITLRIMHAATEVARMEMARPMTIDNFEALAAVPRADGGLRFYLLSDDNGPSLQRTLLLAFDWRPR